MDLCSLVGVNAYGDGEDDVMARVTGMASVTVMVSVTVMITLITKNYPP